LRVEGIEFGTWVSEKLATSLPPGCENGKKINMPNTDVSRRGPKHRIFKNETHGDDVVNVERSRHTRVYEPQIRARLDH